MNRLKELRKEKKLTTVELGKIIGVSDAAISYWENGKRQPSIQTYAQLAQLYGVSIDYLYGITDERTPTAESESNLVNQIDSRFAQLPQTVKMLALSYADGLQSKAKP